MQWALINDGSYLSIAEMRKAMGNIFTLKVNRDEGGSSARLM
jgi:hypothetical protein